MSDQAGQDVPVSSGRTVIVTGGAGFIGSAISAELSDRFDRVVVLDNLHPQIHSSADRPARLDSRVELVVGDVTDAASLDALLSDCAPDVVIHLAAETGTGQSLTEASRHASVNVVGTAQLLDALLRNNTLPRRFVLAGSRAVYGEGAWRRHDGEIFYPGQRTSEILRRGTWDFPDAMPIGMAASVTHPAPVSIYGATKLAQENLITSWSQAVDVQPVILRLQNVYGPGQSLINPYTGILSLFCRLAKEGRSIPLYEDGNVRRDFVFIDDVARAVVHAAVAPSPGVTPIDIGSGSYETIARAAELIAAHWNAPDPHVTGQYRQGDVRHAWAEIDRAELALNWQPRYTLEDGIRQLAEWIDAQETSVARY